jgi:hypothetical protein
MAPLHAHIPIFDPAPSNLVGYWKLSESSGTVAADSSGYGNDGTIYNGVTFEAGRIGGSFKFTGSAANQYVGIPHSTSLNLGNGGSYTVAFWTKVNSLTSQWQHFISKNPPDGNKGPFEVYMDTQGSKSSTLSITGSIKNNILTWPNNTLVYTRSKTGFTNVWHHIALVRNGNSMSLYFGGVHRQTKTPAINDASNTQAITLAQRGDSAVWLDGNLDDVRIYNTNLSSTQIAALAGM